MTASSLYLVMTPLQQAGAEIGTPESPAGYATETTAGAVMTIQNRRSFLKHTTAVGSGFLKQEPAARAEVCDTRGQDVRGPMNVSEEEAAIDQVCPSIRVFRRQNVDVSKRELGVLAARDREKGSRPFEPQSASNDAH
jgi:hypothetical protein